MHENTLPTSVSVAVGFMVFWGSYIPV